MNEKDKAPDYPRISAFDHKHGISLGLVPAGEHSEDYWRRIDNYEGLEDETITDSPLPQPYASALKLQVALQELVDWADTISDGEAHDQPEVADAVALLAKLSKLDQPAKAGVPESAAATLRDPVTVRFVPQAWVRDNAIDVDPEGPTEFQVERADLEGITPNSDESDDLRHHSNAPKWIQDWSGPFYITWEQEE